MKVFISHSSQDKWVARKISEDLNDRGIDTFLDEKDILTGESVDDAIGKHLLECDELLILISPASLSSQWVFVEIGGAKALGKRLVPILFHVGANELPPMLSRFLARDINGIATYYDEAKERSTKVAVPPPTKEIRTKRRKRLKLSIGDRVRIAELHELTEEQKQLPPGWIRGMDKYAGTEAKIKDILGRVGPSEENYYILDIEELIGWHPLWLTKIP